MSADPRTEDRLAELVFPLQAGGEVRLQPVKPCARCAIPNIDPVTAKSDPAVGDTLQTYRQDRRLLGAVTFGMNVIVREGAVISMGVFLGASTKIIDRATGTVYRGEVPSYAVVVPGSLPDPKGGPSLACAVIVKTVDAQTRSKTGINELLRD